MARLKQMTAVIGLAGVIGSGVVRTAWAGQAPQDPSKPPPNIVFNIPPMSERIEIDGSKNPEMIPQWDIWKAAFLIIDKTSDVPTMVWKAATKEEVALIVQAARENAANERSCEARGLKLAELLKSDEARFVNERTQALNLECREKTLELSDRLMSDLSRQAAAALAQYVESLKAGIRVYVPKGELAFYRQPR
jgi:hypothetical protein